MGMKLRIRADAIRPRPALISHPERHLPGPVRSEIHGKILRDRHGLRGQDFCSFYKNPRSNKFDGYIE